jgi:N utilization substance protein B
LATQSRERARNLLVKALYQWQLAGHDESELRLQFAALAEFDRIDQAFFQDLLQKVIGDTQALDALIAGLAVRSLDQLDAVGRAVLLLALAELKFRPDIPTKVIINEAVKLAKRYGAAESFRFINAVTDKAAAELRPKLKASGA